MLMICPNLIKCEASLPLDPSPALSGSDPLPSAPLRTQDPSRYQSINRHLVLMCVAVNSLHWPVWCFNSCLQWLHLFTHLLTCSSTREFNIMTPAVF